MRYVTEKILEHAAHRGNFKRHEIVENVVKVFCDVWNIEDWRDINNPSNSRKMYRAKMSLAILLQNNLQCSLVDVKNYFFINGTDNFYSTICVKFKEYCTYDKRLVALHNECVKRIQSVKRVTKDSYLTIGSKMNNNAYKQEKKNN